MRTQQEAYKTLNNIDRLPVIEIIAQGVEKSATMKVQVRPALRAARGPHQASVRSESQ